MKNKAEVIKKLLVFVVLLSVSVVLLAACGIHYFEKDAQPEKFGSFLDAIRYTILIPFLIGIVA
jgi:hypothetical protein